MVAISKFCLPLLLEYLDGRTWRLLGAFTFGSVHLERVIELPIGFETDFASIPRSLWIWLPPTGRYGKAAVIHDFLCRSPQIASRLDADRVFVEAMEELGVGWLTRQVLYRGVRIGAWWSDR